LRSHALGIANACPALQEYKIEYTLAFNLCQI
jgi:hypothetical protein